MHLRQEIIYKLRQELMSLKQKSDSDKRQLELIKQLKREGDFDKRQLELTIEQLERKGTPLYMFIIIS